MAYAYESKQKPGRECKHSSRAFFLLSPDFPAGIRAAPQAALRTPFRYSFVGVLRSVISLPQCVFVAALRRCVHRRVTHFSRYRVTATTEATAIWHNDFAGRGFASRRKTMGNDQNGSGVAFTVARSLPLRVAAAGDKSLPYDGKRLLRMP